MSSVRNLFSHRTVLGCYIASSGRKMCLENTNKYRNHHPFLLVRSSVHYSCQETIITSEKPSHVTMAAPPSTKSAMADVFFSRFSSGMSERILEVYRRWYMSEIDTTLCHIMDSVESELKKGGHGQIISSVMANPSQDLRDDVWRAFEQVCSADLEKHLEYRFYYQFPLKIGKCPAVPEIMIGYSLQRYQDQEFYMELELLREKIRAQQQVVEKGELEAAQSSRGWASENDHVEDKEGAHLGFSICKRSGSMNLLKIYHDLSYSFLGRVCDKIHDTIDVVHKLTFGKSNEKILPLHEGSNLSPVLAECAKLLQPISVNWNALIDRLKRRQSSRWYFKNSEPVQDEESYETAVREYLMLMDTYLKQNRLEDAERLLKKMAKKGIKQTEDIYITLLRSFAQRGDANGVSRIAVLMESDGLQPTLESCSLLVEVFCQAGGPHVAREHFDHIAKLGKKPGLNLIPNMLVAYEKKELYNDAFDFLMQLEKDGLEHGFSTYLEDSFDRMLLVNETEQLLGDIDQLLQKVQRL